MNSHDDICTKIDCNTCQSIHQLFLTSFKSCESPKAFYDEFCAPCKDDTLEIRESKEKKQFVWIVKVSAATTRFQARRLLRQLECPEEYIDLITDAIYEP